MLEWGHVINFLSCMELKTFIFIGRSGCGKGTQVKLLKEYLGKEDPTRPIFHFETGDRFRSFMEGDSFSSRRTKEIVLAGKRVNSFVAIWLWSGGFIENMRGNEHVIMDGSPRTLTEAHVLDTLMDFYERVEPTIVYMDVSREWAMQRLGERGRADDNDKKKMEEKQNYFESDVFPAVEYYEKNPRYNFVRIKGEQPIEEVHREIMAKVFGA